MKAVVLALAVGCLLIASRAPADEHAEMRAAMQEMLIARSHLQAASHDYAGHRRTAIDHLNQAIGEVREGLKALKSTSPAPKPPPPDDD